MDFMVQLVQFRNNIWLVMVISCTILSCKSDTPNMGSVSMDNHNLIQVQGKLYFKHHLFTGIAYNLYAPGDTAKLVTYKNGVQNGLLKWWYPNKQLSQERFFVNGLKQGTHKGWWPNGTIKFEYHFVNDEHEGELKEWFTNGTVFRVFHYEAGHEAGSEKMWWDDGKIRANYVIVNGEKFGLFGQKICVNDVKI